MVVPESTFYYYRQRETRRTGTKGRSAAKLVRVEIEEPRRASGTFSVVLANGRRIESLWTFCDAELAWLIRVAESA